MKEEILPNVHCNYMREVCFLVVSNGYLINSFQVKRDKVKSRYQTPQWFKQTLQKLIRQIRNQKSNNEIRNTFF